MKRRIYLSLCALSLSAMLIAALAVLLACYGFFSNQIKSTLRDSCSHMESYFVGRSNTSIHPDLNLSDPALRITWIDEEGEVLYDSTVEASELPNHGDRPEVTKALSNGQAEVSRKSDTLGQNTYYFALRLGDGTVLRVSRDVSSLQSLFLGVLPLVGLLVAVLLAACLLLGRFLTLRIIRPLTTIGDSLDHLETEGVYDELSPFINKISKQGSQIQQQLTEMEEDRETIDLIMDNMQEGLILISATKRILSVNQSAVNYLCTVDREFVGQNVVSLTRNGALLSAVDDAIAGRAGNGIIPSGNDTPKSIQFFASPVWNKEAENPKNRVTGVILFLLDVTEQLKAEKIRQEFSANVSHELKTPLTSITGFAEIMKNGMVRDDGEREKFSGMIYDESKRLLAMIDDIMRLSQIEENTRERSTVKVNLFTLARGVCVNLRSQAEKRDVTLNTTGDNVILQGNLSMLHEMVTNLCDNAIKYNRQGGRVDVDVHEEDGKAVLIVRDTGIGIPAEHQERIFERFYRVDKSRSKQTGGTGLGLSIVKHIVEYHGGTIALRSVEEEGTTITITLPDGRA